MADRTSELYEIVSKKGLLADGMTEDMFREQTKTDEGLRSFYDYAKEHGMRVSDWDTFRDKTRGVITAAPTNNRETTERQPAQQAGVSGGSLLNEQEELARQNAILGVTNDPNQPFVGQSAQEKQPNAWQTFYKGLGAGAINTANGLLGFLNRANSAQIANDPMTLQMMAKQGKSPEEIAQAANATRARLDKAENERYEAWKKKADQLSAEAKPDGGEKSFTDYLNPKSDDFDLGKALQLGLGTAAESLPYTASALNPVATASMIMSMSDQNYRQSLIDNPNMSEGKRLASAAGNAAIEMAVEHIGNPFKVFKAGKLTAPNATKWIKQVVKESKDNIYKGILRVLGFGAKEAGKEGGEEVITTAGQDLYNTLLDWKDTNGLGLRSQWERAKQNNPNLTPGQFALDKAEGLTNDFIGGALSGMMMSGPSTGVGIVQNAKYYSKNGGSEASRTQAQQQLFVLQQLSDEFGVPQEEVAQAIVDYQAEKQLTPNQQAIINRGEELLTAIQQSEQAAQEAEQVQQDRQTQLRQQAAQQAQQEVHGMAHQDGNVYYVGIKGNEDAEGYAVSGNINMQQDQQGMYSTSGRDLVTVKMNDGSVQQVPADELIVCDIPVSADELMQERTEHYFAQYANNDLFHVGDKVYIKQDGQQSEESSNITAIDDAGIHVEAYDEQTGQTGEMVIPHEQAAEALAVAEGKTEDNIATYLLPDNTQLRLRKIGDGVYETIAEEGEEPHRFTDADLAQLGAQRVDQPVSGQPPMRGAQPPLQGQMQAPQAPMQPISVTPQAPQFGSNAPGIDELSAEDFAAQTVSFMQSPKVAQGYLTAERAKVNAQLQQLEKEGVTEYNSAEEYRTKAQLLEQSKARLQAQLEKIDGAIAAINAQAEAAVARKNLNEAIRKRAAEFSKQLSANIVIFDSLEQIPESQAEARAMYQQAGDTVDGWYDPRTGDIYMNANAYDDIQRFEEKVFHEVVSHKGLEQLLGTTNYNALCDAVWDSMDEATRKKYMDYAKANNIAKNAKGYQRIAAKEYIAFLSESFAQLELNDQSAEANNIRSEWAKICDFLRELFKKIFGNVQITNEDLAKLVHASFVNMQRQAQGITEEQTPTTNNEIDENGYPFVKASDGTTTFGEIRETSGLHAAPIRLSQGFQGDNGKGYGLAHIEANHGDQIRNAGFNSVEEFVSFVAKNYDEDNIRVGKRRENGNATYLIQVTDTHDNTLFVELSQDGSYWNVNSAGVFRKGYSNKKETVAETEPQQPNNAVSGGSSLSAEATSGTSSTEPNGEPTVSKRKGTTNNSNTQIPGQENAENLQNSSENASNDGEPAKIVPERPNSKQLQGMSFNVAEAEDYIGRVARNILDENGYEDVEIVGTKVIGSRVNGNAREDSDLDCLIEFKGNAREDSLFNLFEEQGIELDGVKVDINPITEGKSGTIEQFMRRSDEYLAEKAATQALYDALAQAEAETDTNPTEAQKKAENYKQGHVTLWGLPITIENPKGSIRRGTDANGKQWEQEMHHTYGKIRRTEGVDGDHIDVFIGPNLYSDKVFVVDQRNVDTGEFDEHKCMLGFDSLADAQNGYLSNYEEGWQGMGTVTEVTMDEFKKWIDSSHRKTKPFAEYKSVKAEGAASTAMEQAPTNNRETTETQAEDLTPLEAAKKRKAAREAAKAAEQAAQPQGESEMLTRLRELQEGEDQQAPQDYLHSLTDEQLDVLEDEVNELWNKARTENNLRDLNDQQIRDKYPEAWKTLLMRNRVYAENSRRYDMQITEKSIANRKAHTESEELRRYYEYEFAYMRASASKGDVLKAVHDAEEYLAGLSYEELAKIYNEIVRLQSENDVPWILSKAYKARSANMDNEGVFDYGLNHQGEIPEGKANKPKINASDWTAKDDLRPVLQGVYHDPTGVGVVTNAHILMATPSLYDPAQEGKIVKKDGSTVYGKFPNWQGVVDQARRINKKEATVDWTAIRNFIAGIKAKMKEEGNPLKKDSLANIIIRMPDGQVIIYRLNMFIPFADAAAAVGANTLHYSPINGQTLAEVGDSHLVIIPIDPESFRKNLDWGYKDNFYYDLQPKQDEPVSAETPKTDSKPERKPKPTRKKAAPAEQTQAPVETDAEVIETQKPKNTDKIEDVGEKIGGARKDIVQETVDRINVNGDTFAKIFPKFDYHKLIANGLEPRLAAGLKYVCEHAKKSYKIRKKRFGENNALEATRFMANYAKGYLLGDTSLDFTSEGWVFTAYGKRRYEFGIKLWESLREAMGDTMFDVDLSGYDCDVIQSEEERKAEAEEKGRTYRPSSSIYYRRNADGESVEFTPRYAINTPKGDKLFTAEEYDQAVQYFQNQVTSAINYQAANPFELAIYRKRGSDDCCVYAKIGGKWVELTPWGKEYGLKYRDEHRAELQVMAQRKAEELKEQRKNTRPEAKVEVKWFPGTQEQPGDYRIATKVGKEYMPISNPMLPKDIWRYAREHHDELQAKAQELLNAYLDEQETNKGWKPQLNIGGLRNRVGTDWRNGADVTAERFRTEFGFRGVEFGNYVTQKERQRLLNECFDALHDMAEILGVSPRALSLNAQLGFAIGARGGAGAKAHYEPGKNVINLTKKNGWGALAHEWWHAMDYYFGKREKERPATGGVFREDVRKEMQDAFAAVMKAINDSEYLKRSQNLDAKTNKRYYAEDTELGARAFEDYIAKQLIERGQVNDFLSHHTSEEDWNGDISNYPYPIEKDGTVLADAFQSFFDIIEEQEDASTGNSVLFSVTDKKYAQFALTQANNPMLDDVHTGIRSVEDIHTLEETLNDDQLLVTEPDWEEEDIRRAIEDNQVTIYSSKPIQDGTFVTPSRMVAEDYAGGEMVYEKTVSPDKVAWIASDEGQYADVDHYDGNILFSITNANNEIFYSNAERAVEGIKQDKATPEQWRAMIEKAGGLKAGEDKWIGLSDWLSQQRPTIESHPDETPLQFAQRAQAERKKFTISKQEILHYIRANKIQIEETEYGEASPETSPRFREFQDEVTEMWENVNRMQNGRFNEANQDIIRFEDDMQAKYGDDWRDLVDESERNVANYLQERRDEINMEVFLPEEVVMEEMCNRHGDDFQLAFSIDDDGSLSIANEDAADYYLDVNPIKDTRLQYTTEGLTNKHEIAMTVPTIEAWNETDEIHFGDAGEGRVIAWVRFGDAKTISKPEELVQAEQEYKEFSRKMIGQYGLTYTERVMSDSERQQESDLIAKLNQARKNHPQIEGKVLVIDEIQSKRHQEGREKGYVDVSNTGRIKYLENKIQDGYSLFSSEAQEVERMMQKPFVANEYHLTPDATWLEMYDDEYQYYTDFAGKTYSVGKWVGDEEDARQYLHELITDDVKDHNKSIRDAIPAAPFEKNWHELAMKRILRFAAENGYDKVAWTTGDQQAARYDIGAKVEKVTVEPYGNGRKEVKVYKPDGYADVIDFDENGFCHDDHYNGAIKNKSIQDIFGKDLGKKIAEATDKSTFEGEELRIGGEGMKGFYDDILPRFMQKYGKKWGVQVGEVTMPQLEDGYQTMHSVDVTPEMRESVLQGQPMFSITPKNTSLDHVMFSITEKDPLKRWEAENPKPKAKEGEPTIDYAKRLQQWNNEHRKVKDAIKDAQPSYDHAEYDGVLFSTTPPFTGETIGDVAASARQRSDINRKRRESAAITDMLIQLSKDNYWRMQEALHKINADIRALRKAAAMQADLDRSQVEALLDLTNQLIQVQWGGGSDNPAYQPQTMATIIQQVRNAIGKADISEEVGKIEDYLVHAQRVAAKNQWDKLRRTPFEKLNISGVVSQGKVAIQGQHALKALNEALNSRMTVEQLEEEISLLYQKIDEATDESLRTQYTGRMIGYETARQHLERLEELMQERQQLRNELEASRTKKELSQAARRELEASIKEALRDNNLRQAEAYTQSVRDLQEYMSGQTDIAKNFIEQQRQRTEMIRGYAAKDLEGASADPHRTNEKQSGWRKIWDAFASPIRDLQSLLRLTGLHAPDGEGYLYNHFMRNWTDAADKERQGIVAAQKTLDAKISEQTHGKYKTWEEAARDIKSKSHNKLSVSLWTGKFDGIQPVYEDIPIDAGNALYIYAVNKMNDGRMKLTAMNITDQKVRDLANQVKEMFGQEILDVVDWVQREFFSQLRNRYNPTHEALFGAPMDAIENYFPLRINANARQKNEDITEPDDDASRLLSGTSTGAIKRRKRNSLPLDVRNADFFQEVIRHMAQMERWNAFAQWTRDANILFSDIDFRNKIKNMSTIYGKGDKLYKYMKDAFQTAVGVYKPKSDIFSEMTLNLAKGVTSAKINFRWWTALKQIASFPAFFTYMTDGVFVQSYIRNWMTPHSTMKWAKENLPNFEKRLSKRDMGDMRLMQRSTDWEWNKRMMEFSQKYGMWANVMFDTLTCATGARAVYDSRLAEYLQKGYSQEQAEQRARQDAEQAFNTSQQSSEGAYMAPVQMDRNIITAALTVFRTSPIQYTRNCFYHARNLLNKRKKGTKASMIDFRTQQYIADGLSEEQARNAAEKDYNKSVARDIVGMVVYGALLGILWRMVGSLPYLIAGDDDDKKKKMLKDAVTGGAIVQPVTGLLGGGIVESALDGYGNVADMFSPDMPFSQDLKRVFDNIKYDKRAEAASQALSILMQSATGFDPLTAADMITRVVTTLDSDAKLDAAQKAWQITGAVLSIPQSQYEQIMIDDMVKAGKGIDMSNTFGKRKFEPMYDKYLSDFTTNRMIRTAPLTWYLRSDEAKAKAQQSAESMSMTSFRKQLRERGLKDLPDTKQKRDKKKRK